MKYLIIVFSAFLLVACKKEKETVSGSKTADFLTIAKD